MKTTIPTEIAERVSKVNYGTSGAWNPEPFQIVSLWDMINFQLRRFFQHRRFLEIICEKTTAAMKQGDGSSKLTDSDLLACEFGLSGITELCVEAQMEASLIVIERIQPRLPFAPISEIKNLRRERRSILRSVTFWLC